MIRPVIFGSHRGIAAGVVECLVEADLDFSVVTYGGGADYSTHERCVDQTTVPPRNVFRPDPVFAEAFAQHLDLIGGNLIVPTGMLSCMALSMMQHWLPPGSAYPVSDIQVIRMLDNKWTFAGLLTEWQIATPRSWLIEAVEAIPADLPFPVICKPPGGGGGFGIARADDVAALRKVCESARTLPIIAQEYIPGQDIDVSALAIDGIVIAHTIQKWLSENELEFLDEAEPLEMASRIIGHSGFSGVVHFDMRIDERDGTLYMIEANPRFWGTVGASIKAGVNFPVVGARIALGMDRPQRLPPPKACRVHLGELTEAAAAPGQKVGARGLVLNL